MSEKLHVACYGMAGHQIIGRLKDHPRAVLVAVAGIDADTVRRSVGEDAAGCVRIEAELDALIAAPDIDLISFCSPRRDQQLEQSIRALRAGRNVLAEKPCAMTVDELDRLEQVMAECEAEYWPMASCAREGVLQAIRDLVEAGRLGQIAYVVAQKSYPYHGGRPQDRGVDGGLIRQSGIHGVRYIQWATGQRAVRVSGFDTTFGNPRPGELQMAACVSLELDGGAVAQLGCNYLNTKGFGSWGNEMLRVSGTGGTAEAVDGFARCRMFLGEEPEQPIPGADGGYPDFFDSYVAHLLDGSAMPYSLEDDLYALRTVCRAQEAVDKGCVLDV